MARRRQSALDDTFALLKVTPIWVGPVLALALFILLRFLVPLLLPVKPEGVDTGAVFRPLIMMLSWLVPAAVLLAWIAAEIWKLMNRRLLDGQSGLARIRDISWREFERLVSEAYRRKGYLAEVVGTSSGDGGMDIRLTGHGETVIVQCKQWKAFKVGVTTVRELLGVVVSEKADRGIVVTSGRFTREALDFAQRNDRIELLDGPGLAELVRDVQVDSSAAPSPTPIASSQTSAPTCPLCGNPMVLRTARKGQKAGSQFWGCSTFGTSGCKGTRQAG